MAMAMAMASSSSLFFSLFFSVLLNSPRLAFGVTNPAEVQVLKAIASANPVKLGYWMGDDPCGSKWPGITCKGSSITQIVLKDMGLTGYLPSFSPLSNLAEAYISNNGFTLIPSDFFTGLSSLTVLNMEDNPLLNSSTGGWQIPESIGKLTSLQTLYMTNCSLVGVIPSFLGTMPSLRTLRLSYNKLTGGLPPSFENAGFEKLVLNQLSLEGPIDVVGTMPRLKQLWLHVNRFTGVIPSGLASIAVSLEDCQLNDNNLVGEIPPEFTSASSLRIFIVRNNKLVGKIPSILSIDNTQNYSYSGNNFCVDTPGKDCAPQTSALLAFLGGVSYPTTLLNSWETNDPCSPAWFGIGCDNNSNVIWIDLSNLGLTGSISPALSNLTSLTKINLSRNNLTGLIPDSLTTLKLLEKLDVSNNNLFAPVPSFSIKVVLNTDGNPNITMVYTNSSSPPPSSPSPLTPSDNGNGSATPTIPSPSGQTETQMDNLSSIPLGTIVGAVIGVVFFVFILGIFGFFLWRKKRQGFHRVQSPNTLPTSNADGSNNGMKIAAVAGYSSSVNTTTITTTYTTSTASSDPTHTYVVADGGSLVISIQVLRSVTNEFSDENILGRGGFGVVYKGELDDGTIIAVKRMETSAMSNKGLKEFQAEIDVLTKVRHRNLVSLLGYCIEDNEKLLVYEYMPLGTLSEHIFEGPKKGFPSMSWNRRLSIALDVARGIEYLHSLAHQSFIHRDLKPSNILLGEDYRAKVSDFGLVKLAPEGKFSVETRLAGTFGYLAPEYAVTGRVTTKSDVFSFGVILMELITGRRAIDDTQPEETVHLVTWFRRTFTKVGAIVKVLDPVITMELSSSPVPDETLESICKVAELAGHCTAREPYNRPDMGHAVGVLSLLLEAWTPSDSKGDDDDGIDLNMTLPQALKKWQALGGSVSTGSDLDMENTQSSLPARPAGFADSFTSSDGR